MQAAGDPPLNGTAGVSEQTATTPAVTRSRRGLALVCVAVGLLWAALDQLTKTLVVHHLRDGRVIRLLGGHLLLEQDRNPGAAFGIGTGSTVVFSAVAIVVIAIVLRTARRLGSWGWTIALGLLLGGAVGNLTDRLLRSPGALRGWVVDWIDLRWWPVFNLADSGIVIGAIVVVALSLRGVRLDGGRG